MPGASASVVARRHDVNTNLLFTWRRQLGGGDAASGQDVSFVPATIAAEAPPVAPCSGGNDRIEIVLASGTRIIVGTEVDAAALARVVKVLARPMIPVPSGVRVWIAIGHTDMRKGMNGLALLVQEHAQARPARRRSLRLPGAARRSDQDRLARRDRAVALRQAAGPGPVRLAVDGGRGGCADGGAAGLHAGRDRLAQPAAHLAAGQRPGRGAIFLASRAF